MLKLELSLDETNAVLASLGKMPFEAVAGLIQKIKDQAVPQLQNMPAPEPAEQPAE